MHECGFAEATEENRGRERKAICRERKEYSSFVFILHQAQSRLSTLNITTACQFWLPLLVKDSVCRGSWQHPWILNTTEINLYVLNWSGNNAKM